MVPGVLDKLRLWPVRAGVAIVEGGLLRRDLKLCETGISLERMCNPLGRVVLSQLEEATVTPHKLPNAVIEAGNNNKDTIVSSSANIQPKCFLKLPSPRGEK